MSIKQEPRAVSEKDDDNLAAEMKALELQNSEVTALGVLVVYIARYESPL